jgi:hypothetical protein
MYILLHVVSRIVIFCLMFTLFTISVEKGMSE